MPEDATMPRNSPGGHAPPGVDRKIVGFHQDDFNDWVAELACGHDQHVRHDPPWTNRPWVVTPEGRERTIGRTLPCRKCNEGAPRDRPGGLGAA